MSHRLIVKSHHHLTLTSPHPHIVPSFLRPIVSSSNRTMISSSHRHMSRAPDIASLHNAASSHCLIVVSPAPYCLIVKGSRGVGEQFVVVGFGYGRPSVFVRRGRYLAGVVRMLIPSSTVSLPPPPPPATVLISATHPAKRCRLVSCCWCVLVVWSCWSFASFSCLVVRWLCGFVCVALWCCFAVVGVAVLCCSAPELLWCCVAPVVCVGVWCVCRVWSLCGVLVCRACGVLVSCLCVVLVCGTFLIRCLCGACVYCLRVVLITVGA